MASYCATSVACDQARPNRCQIGRLTRNGTAPSIRSAGPARLHIFSLVLYKVYVGAAVYARAMVIGQGVSIVDGCREWHRSGSASCDGGATVRRFSFC
jgi:hypothetical protein